MFESIKYTHDQFCQSFHEHSWLCSDGEFRPTTVDFEIRVDFRQSSFLNLYHAMWSISIRVYLKCEKKHEFCFECMVFIWIFTEFGTSSTHFKSKLRDFDCDFAASSLSWSHDPASSLFQYSVIICIDSLLCAKGCQESRRNLPEKDAA